MHVHTRLACIPVQARRKAQGTGAGMPSMVEALRLQDDVDEAAEAESSGACVCARILYVQLETGGWAGV
jgi:hypothetical protein